MEKITMQTLQARKANRQKIAALAVTDYAFAKLAEGANVDCILVGDSIGMTVFGFDSLLPVTMDLMVPHACAVRKGAPHSFLIGDLPFLTYETNEQDAIRNAGRFMAECGCDAVKLEGGRNRAAVVKSLVNASIPVVGHIGFTPQAMTLQGGFKTAGHDVPQALRLIEDAKVLEESGICMLMLEAVPADIAAMIADKAGVPVIGFGSGPHIDGQILLLHDLIGMFDSFTKKFSKQYVNAGKTISDAMRLFLQDVERGEFPAREQYFEMSPEESRMVKAAAAKKGLTPTD